MQSKNPVMKPPPAIQVEEKPVEKHLEPYNETVIGVTVNASSLSFKKGETVRQCAYPKCGNEFYPTRYWQKFCSVQCRGANYWLRYDRVTIPKANVPIEQQP